MNKKKIKKEYSILGTNMTEEVTLEFRLKKKKKMKQETTFQKK